jgi:hypothetical protein
VDFAGYYEFEVPDLAPATELNAEVGLGSFEQPLTTSLVGSKGVSPEVPSQAGPAVSHQHEATYSDLGADKIPVRLSKGRRAWIEIPSPFYEADKIRLKKQIDLLLSDDEGEEDLEDK